MSDVITGEFTDKITEYPIPLGSYYFQYSSSFSRQGAVSQLCITSAVSDPTSVNAHYVSGNVKGHIYIGLRDEDNKVRRLIDSNQTTAGVTLLDKNKQYYLTIDKDPGLTRVVCEKCGAINYIMGEANPIFRAYKQDIPNIVTQPENIFCKINGTVSFTVIASLNSTRQWQMSRDNGLTFIDLENGTNADGVTISNSTNSTLGLKDIPELYNKYIFRCKITEVNTENTIYTNNALLFVGDEKDPPKSIIKTYINLKNGG